MKTLKFTHKQIELILTALGIAEKANMDVYKQLCDLAMVRNNAEKSNEIDDAKLYHEKACKYADLNASIEKGEMDV